MAAHDGQSVTDHGDAVVEIVTNLHAAAKAGRALLERVEHMDLGDDLYDEMHAARAAYDRLAGTSKP